MRSFNPGEVVNVVVNRDNPAVAARGELQADRSRETFDWGQVTESHIDPGGGARRFYALPRVAVSENVGQIVREQRCVPRGQTFAVVQIGKGRRLSRELRQRRVTVVLQIAA